MRVHTMQICEHFVVSRYTNTTKDTDSENYHHKLILTVASSSADTARDCGYIPSCSPKIPPHIIHDYVSLGRHSVSYQNLEMIEQGPLINLSAR